MAQKYKTNVSYALLDMIQVVSAHRVFPPLSDRNKYQDHYHKYQLTSANANAVNTALADKYGNLTVNQLQIANRQLTTIKQEKKRLLEKNQRLKNEHLNFQTKLGCTEKMIKQMGEYFDIKGDVKSIMEELSELTKK